MASLPSRLVQRPGLLRQSAIGMTKRRFVNQFGLRARGARSRRLFLASTRIDGPRLTLRRRRVPGGVLRACTCEPFLDSRPTAERCPPSPGIPPQQETIQRSVALYNGPLYSGVMTYRLSKVDLAHLGDIRGAAEALTSHVEDMQARWDDSTERWQESERGLAVQEWLTQLEDQLREISDLAEEIENSEPEST